MGKERCRRADASSTATAQAELDRLNKSHEKSLASQSGRDVKGLTKEEEKARKEAAARSKADKAAKDDELRRANSAHQNTLKKTGKSISVDLDAETEALRAELAAPL